MPDLNVAAIERAVLSVPVPGLDCDLAAAGAVITTTAERDQIRIGIKLGFPAAGLRSRLCSAATEAVRTTLGFAASIEVTLDWEVLARSPQGNLKPLPGVRNVIAVASGKGGVGKSTTAVNLALALAAEGASVGIVDADVYGPSQPRMLGLKGAQPESHDGKTIEPLRSHGLQVMSVGFMVPDGTPVIWRGPIVTQAVSQITLETHWQDLDYLVMDLPPGTGDTQLTVSQKVPVAGVVVVTTPQPVATEVARRGLEMFVKVGVPILGVIENMSTFVCRNCAHEEPLFGGGGGEELAAACGVPLLGRLPLDPSVRERTDAGIPPVVADPGGTVALRYREIARRVAALLSRRPRDLKHKLPGVVVEGRK